MTLSGRRASIVLVLVVAAGLRLSFGMPGVWQQPWTPHHFDEHFLPQEALAQWEGVTPREVGWPASTMRLVLSAAYAGPLLADRRDALAAASDVGAAMGVVAQWVGERAGDDELLYVIGRGVSAAFGLLHVIFAMLAARAWLGPASMPVAGALVAVSPLAVSHSQLVLADVMGAGFATLVLALAPRVQDPRVAPWMGIAAGLATASKFHFGIWLLFAVAAVWIPRDAPWRQRLGTTLVVLAAFTLTVVALVPWVWTNPVLTLKEFAVVVLAKAGDGAGGGALLGNALTVLRGLGIAVLVGAVAGAPSLARPTPRLGLALSLFCVLILAMLSGSALVFERHGLLLLPGLALLGAAGWQRLGERWPPFGPGVALAVILLIGLPSSVRAIDEFRTINSYHAAHDWLRAHLPDDASVAIYSEDNQYLPRTADQLAECAGYAFTEEAYREKWATNTVTMAPGSGMPMQFAVVADEMFHAYWCARERLAVHSPAFVVHRFHPEPRFQTLRVSELRDEFKAGLVDPARGFDAVLVHFDLAPDLTPAMTFNEGRGPLLRLYLRPGISLR